MRDRIQRIIEDKKMTPSSFADEVGLNRAVVSHILHGRNKPGLENLQRILARFPEINPGWLITGAGSMYTGSNEAYSTPTLFDEEDEFSMTGQGSAEFSKEMAFKSPVNTNKNTVNQTLEIESKPSVRVKKIAVFYSDNTYEEFLPIHKG
jgi:transcriptional regulator with XRE-family HTH domain